VAHRTYDRPPEMALDPDKDYHANLLTEKGTIRIRLFAREAPETVNNFVFLAREATSTGPPSTAS
jgi:Cyclophilin type peptidyl-prolyl cis-trans isomerase/CLD